jgi:magnesium and cobalt exporter, CNNM family
VVPDSVLVGALIALILVSGFFSAAEIGLMTLNRYRLRHLADTGHGGAQIAARLLRRPDRLLGVILLGNNATNITAASIATLLAFEHYGERAVAIASGILTFVVLVFAEVAPKTLAALYPERVAFPAAYILRPMLKLFYPLVWFTNGIANGLLGMFGVSLKKTRSPEITAEELRALVREADVLIPESHQDMLLAILDLEKVTVDDVMVPRVRIEGINLDADWDDVTRQLASVRFTRVPVYHGSLDNVSGMIHVRQVLNLLREGKLDRESLMAAIREPYFIPRGTSLNTQLLNFRAVRRRIGLVVDEYGDIQGLVTLDEILEEIVGEFTTQALGLVGDVQPQEDGSYLVKGTATLRDLNRKLDWDLPTDESRTVNGLIVGYLEDLPAPGTSLKVGGYQLEILRTRGTAVETVRIRRVPRDETPPREG